MAVGQMISTIATNDYVIAIACGFALGILSALFI